MKLTTRVFFKALLIFGFAASINGCGGEATPYSYGGKEKPVLTATFSPLYTSETEVTLQLSSSVSAAAMTQDSSLSACTTNVSNYAPFLPSFPFQIDTLNAVSKIWVKVRSVGRVWSDCVEATVTHDDLTPDGVSNFKLITPASADLLTSPTLSWTGGADNGLAGINRYVGTMLQMDGNDYIIVSGGFTVANNTTVDMTSMSLADDADYTIGVVSEDRALNKSLQVVSESWFSGGGTLNTLSKPNDGFAPIAMAIGDLNGDGTSDIVAGDYLNKLIQAYYSDGLAEPSFTSAAVSTNHWGIFDIKIADLNGDGANDIIIAAAFEGEVVWLENDGAASPTFTEHILPFTLLGASAIDIADIDADGDLDIIAGAIYENNLVWFENDGLASPTFTRTDIYTSAFGVSEVLAQDLNGDGDIDIVITTEGDDSVAWLENDGAVTPSFSYNLISNTMLYIQGAAIGDINNDGAPDIVSASWLSGEIGLHLNDGNATPTFSSSLGALLATVRAVEIADMDGDGNPDIAAVSGSGQLRIFLGNGLAAPTFTEKFITDRAFSSQKVFPVDLDGDGDLDLISQSGGAPLCIER